MRTIQRYTLLLLLAWLALAGCARAPARTAPAAETDGPTPQLENTREPTPAPALTLIAFISPR